MSEDRSTAEIIAYCREYYSAGWPRMKEAADRLAEQALDIVYKDEVISMLQLKIRMLEDPAGGRT